jgi:hypothetical protein
LTKKYLILMLYHHNKSKNTNRHGSSGNPLLKK